MSNTGLIIILVALIALSAFFSAGETAFSTCNRIKLKSLANRDNASAQLVLRLLENYDQLITATLIGNNFVNIATATLATELFIKWDPAHGAAYSALAMTLIILIFGEITPKTLANRYADDFAMASAPAFYGLEIILWPLTWIFGLLRKVLDHWTDDPKAKEGYTNDELITMVDEVEKDGTMEADESELVRSAIEFNDLDVRDILTPRVDVVAINRQWPLDRIRKTFEDNQYSRLPVYEGDIDHIIGFIHEKDFFIGCDQGVTDIRKLLQPLIVVPLSLSMIDALKMMQKSKTHLAIVADEYGGTEGIVTMEDILEELVGEIWDEHDEVELDKSQVNVNTWNFTGSCSLAEMFDCFPKHADDADRFDSDTVGGFVCELLERMPKKMETLYYDNLKIIVLDVSDRAVIKVQITMMSDQPSGKEKE